MSLKITVITASCRDTYMKEQVEALKSQNFKDFEWVFVDDLYDKRKGLLPHLIDGAFPLTHIPPREIVPYVAISMAFNTGLIHCRGELIYFMCDYIIPRFDCIGRHWEIYQKYHNVMISGRSIAVGYPTAILNGFSGKIQGSDYRMGLFDQIFGKSKIEDNLFEAHQDDGIRNWWAGRNDSAPLEAILDCNGFDEVFDGALGNTDADLAKRLRVYGLRYLLDYQSSCLEFAHKTGSKEWLRSDEEQRQLEYKITDVKVRQGIYTSGLDRNLREERKRCLKL